VFLIVERVLSRRTSYFFSQAQGDAERAVALGIAREAETMVIGNGVDFLRFASAAPARAETRRTLGLPDDAVALIIIARLVREKGLIELADAVRSLAGLGRLHVVLVGESLPSDRTSIMAQLDRHPVAEELGSRWKRLGHRTDVPALLNAADLFVLPTYREGLPRSIIEAMASGLAVIATDIPACRELVREHETGLLVPPRDWQALAAAIASLVKDDRLRAELGTRGRDVAQRELDESFVLRRQLAVLRRLVTR